MHNTIDSELNPTTLRAAIVATIAGSSVMALGFAPVPQLWYVLAASVLITIVALLTGPKFTNVSVEPPMVLLTLIPAALAVGFRFTSLIWAVVPVLAFVVGAATWMLVSNRYAVATAEATVDTPVVPTDELAPKREEKTAVTNEDSSATAA